MSVVTKFRRHLFATAWVTLSVQTFVIALGTAQVCQDREHTHGGIPAPDCPMHHQVQTASEVVQHHSHHGHATAPEVPGSGGQRMTCRCSDDGPSLFLGQSAIRPAPASWSPVLIAVTLDAPGDPSVTDLWISPPSPPPR